MHTNHTPPAMPDTRQPLQPIALDAIDDELRALTRHWFERDLESRIDGAFDRHLPRVLAGEASMATPCREAA
jgi:hypothetical protein